MLLTSVENNKKYGNLLHWVEKDSQMEYKTL